MLKRKCKDWVVIQSMMVFFRSIAPACSIYTTTLAWRSLTLRQWPEITLFRCWCAAETVFCLFYLYYQIGLQRETVFPTPRAAAEQERFPVDVMNEAYDLEAWICGYFSGARIEEIGRSNVKHFMHWAFWHCRATDEDETQMDEYISLIEERTGKRFAQGSTKVKSLRWTLEPVHAHCRSLIWYAIFMGLDTACHIQLRRHGFQHFSSHRTALEIFPPRPAVILDSKKSPADTMSYWLRPHTSTTRLPILFLHGIGGGLFSYVPFLTELDQTLNNSHSDEDQVGILVIELLAISMRLTHPLWYRDEFLDELQAVLNYHGFHRVVLCCHSYGSTLGSHLILRDLLAPRIASILLVDPITIGLHMPSIGYNFMFRHPRHADEWQLWFFCCRDPGTSHTIARRSFWSDCVLWRYRIEELVQRGVRVTVAVASEDLLVDTRALGWYLMERDEAHSKYVAVPTGEGANEVNAVKGVENVGSWKGREWRGEGLEIIWWQGINHAEAFDRREARAQLAAVLANYCQSNVKHT